LVAVLLKNIISQAFGTALGVLVTLFHLDEKGLQVFQPFKALQLNPHRVIP
jgi:hypothetical protein